MVLSSKSGKSAVWVPAVTQSQLINQKTASEKMSHVPLECPKRAAVSANQNVAVASTRLGLLSSKRDQYQ